MAWTNNAPTNRIPAATKRRIRTRQGNQCNTISFAVCTGAVDEFDHIINIKTLGIDRAKANDIDNLQGLCAPCHKVKTQREAQAARSRWKRQPEPHPGLTR